jgi:hypothetical protein
MHAEPSRARAWGRRLTAWGVAACGLGLIADAVLAAPPPTEPPAAQPTPANDYATRPVAYIYGNVPVTRADLGEFLMARGGASKLELLVNKKIIEHECARRNVSVTDQEMEAALLEDISGLKIQKKDFIKVVLPRYGKTLYEWMEDVVRPRLLLAKLCKDRVKVADADLKIQFEREFGEKRKVQIVMWPSGDDKKAILDQCVKARSSQEEFDRIARAQANPSLAAIAGYIQPISRHVYAKDPIIEKKAFELNVGEVSELLQTSQGYVVMKLHAVIPPDAKADFARERDRLYKQAYDEKMSEEIPKCFAELKAAAKPNVLFTGPPQWRMNTVRAETAEDILKGVAGTLPPGTITPASGTAPPKQMPMKK